MRRTLPVFRTPLDRRGRPVVQRQDLPSGWQNWRSGLITRHAGGGTKVYVACEDDGCEGCADSCQRRPVCPGRCMATVRCNRHFVLEWQERTRFALNPGINRENVIGAPGGQNPGQQIKETEWTERLEEGVDKLIERRKREGF